MKKTISGSGASKFIKIPDEHPLAIRSVIAGSVHRLRCPHQAVPVKNLRL
jgi:hypothetical protein